MEIEAAHLLLLTDDQINYDDLSAGVLFELAVQRDEPFIATSALGQLAVRFPTNFISAAQNILQAPWDRHLTSYALQILFSERPREEMHFVQTFASSSDPVILEAVVECVMAEPIEFSDEFKRSLAVRIRAVTDHRFMSPDVIVSFLNDTSGHWPR